MSVAKDNVDKLQQAGVLASGPKVEVLRPVFESLTEDEVALLIGINEKMDAAMPDTEAHEDVTVGGKFY